MGGMFSGNRYGSSLGRTKRFTCELASIDSLKVHKALCVANETNSLDNFGSWNMFHLSYNDYLLQKKAYVCFIGYDKHQGLKISVRLNATPCYFGGFRCWFLCNLCEKRARFLYFSGNNLTCRSCQNLAYLSQNRSFSDRILDNRRKIWKRLGKNENRMARPKGMHFQTYMNLCEAESELEHLSFRAFLTKAKTYQQVKNSSLFKALTAFERMGKN
jgi:hypothetical protein